jgi:hypothetical protein
MNKNNGWKAKVYTKIILFLQSQHLGDFSKTPIKAPLPQIQIIYGKKYFLYFKIKYQLPVATISFKT